MKRVLFVCSGNTCRSPMAAGIFNKLTRERRLSGVRAESAGTGALDGMRATPQAITVAGADGVDLKRHRSRAISEALLAQSDLVLTMTGRHWYDVTDLAKRDSAFKLTDFDPEGNGEDIDDPYGGSVAVYQEVYDLLKGTIERSLPAIMKRLREPQESRR